jgi:putative ABC transport system ATP-binding protein
MAVFVEQLRKQFRAPDGSVVPVLDIPRLTIGDQEQLALVGSSGSGKSTLLHILAGILPADSGSVRFVSPDGSAVELSALNEVQRDQFRGRYLGYVFQTHHLLPGMTAMENVLLGMSFTGRRADREWARTLLERVALSDRLHYRPAKLSIGQQQRVAVARALANRPKLVLADEPTGALDPRNARSVLALIRDLCRETHAGLLVVTHDMEIAGQFDRMIDLASINRAQDAAPASGGVR